MRFSFLRASVMLIVKEGMATQCVTDVPADVDILVDEIGD